MAGKADAAVDGVLMELELVAAGGGEGAGVAVETQALVCHQPAQDGIKKMKERKKERKIVYFSQHSIASEYGIAQLV